MKIEAVLTTNIVYISEECALVFSFSVCLIYWRKIEENVDSQITWQSISFMLHAQNELMKYI